MQGQQVNEVSRDSPEFVTKNITSSHQLSHSIFWPELSEGVRAVRCSWIGFCWHEKHLRTCTVSTDLRRRLQQGFLFAFGGGCEAIWYWSLLSSLPLALFP